MLPMGPSSSSLLYDGIVAGGLEIGRLITKGEMSEILGQEFGPRRSLIYPVIKRIQVDHRRTLVAERGKGYRVADPKETESIVNQRVERSRRQIVRGRHTIRHTDLKELSQEERRRLEVLQSGLLAVEQELDRVKRRLSAAEVRIEALEGEPRLDPDDIEFLRRLRRQQEG